MIFATLRFAVLRKSLIDCSYFPGDGDFPGFDCSPIFEDVVGAVESKVFHILGILGLLLRGGEGEPR